jgi:hypothetical protein
MLWPRYLTLLRSLDSAPCNAPYRRGMVVVPLKCLERSHQCRWTCPEPDVLVAAAVTVSTAKNPALAQIPVTEPGHKIQILPQVELAPSTANRTCTTLRPRTDDGGQSVGRGRRARAPSEVHLRRARCHSTAAQVDYACLVYPAQRLKIAERGSKG